MIKIGDILRVVCDRGYSDNNAPYGDLVRVTHLEAPFEDNPAIIDEVQSVKTHNKYNSPRAFVTNGSGNLDGTHKNYEKL